MNRQKSYIILRREKKDEYYRRKIRTGIYPHVQ